VAATVASCSGVVPNCSMCRLAMSANSTAVNMPYPTTNSLVGRVQGAVEARSVYTPALPPTTSATWLCPVAINDAASNTAGIPSPFMERRQGPKRNS
jgi:hypothetical protein